MFDSETRWFIRCDTCPDDRAQILDPRVYVALDTDHAKRLARDYGWEIRDDLHRCPACVHEGRKEMV